MCVLCVVCVCVCVCWGVVLVGTQVLRLMRAFMVMTGYSGSQNATDTLGRGRRGHSRTEGKSCCISSVPVSFLPLLCHRNTGSCFVGLRCGEFGTDLGNC